jgi:hypothetical protein
MDLAEHPPVGHLPRITPAHPADNGLLPDTTPAPDEIALAAREHSTI